MAGRRRKLRSWNRNAASATRFTNFYADPAVKAVLLSRQIVGITLNAFGNLTLSLWSI